MEFRSFAPDLEVRHAATGRRLLCGIVVPFGHNQRINPDLVERFDSGSFDHQFRAAHRVQLLNQHSIQPGHLPLGHGVELRNERAGLYGEFRVVESAMGDHFLSLVEEGSLREWSIGFQPHRVHDDAGVRVYTRATVFETALTPEGAYGELASVGAVHRAADTAAAVPSDDDLRARLPDAVPATVYRFYDRGGTLLYVGVTGAGRARGETHSRTAEWWTFVARQEVEHVPNRVAALRREQELIRQFRPPFNTAHNPDSARLRAAYLAYAGAVPSTLM